MFKIVESDYSLGYVFLEDGMPVLEDNVEALQFLQFWLGDGWKKTLDGLNEDGWGVVSTIHCPTGKVEIVREEN